jgi:hypothetical protein
MKALLQPAIFFLLLLANCPLGFAQTETFDLITFKLPPGNWKSQQTLDYVLFQEIKGAIYCQLAIYRSREGSTNALQNFTQEYEAIAISMLGADPNPKTTQETTPAGWTSVSATGKFSKNGASGSTRMLVLTSQNTLVTLVMSTNDNSYLSVIQAFLDSIKLKMPANNHSPQANGAIVKTNEGSSPTSNSDNSTFVSNGLPGVWAGLDYGFAVKSHGTVIEKGMNYLIIYSDGKLREGSVFPRQGLDGFNRAENLQRDAGYWANYSLADKLARFEYRKIEMEYAAGKLIYGGDAYTKLPYVDGLRLSATYTADPKGAEYLGYEPVITFYADGRFSDNGALNRADDLAPLHKKFGSGTYQINNFTIYLTYADGRGTSKLSFLSVDGISNPRSIFIAQKNLLKK